MRLMMLCCLLAGGLTLYAQDLQFGIGLSSQLSTVDIPGLEGEQLNPPGLDPRIDEGIGFGINIYSRLLINDWLSLSSAPTILFQNNTLSYQPLSGGVAEEELYPVSVALPVAFEFNPGRAKLRPHFSAGIGVLLSLSQNNDDEALELRKNVLFGQLSAGATIKSSKFFMRPEIVFWQSLANLLEGELNGETLDAAWRQLGVRVLFYGNRNS